MSDNHIARSILVLDAADTDVLGLSRSLTGVVLGRAPTVMGLLDPASGVRPELAGVAQRGAQQMNSLIIESLKSVSQAIATDRLGLRGDLWLEPPPANASGAGHLVPFTDRGEPQAPPGSVYAPAQLKLPDPGVAELAAQNPVVSNCFWAVAHNMLAHKWPEVFDGRVTQEGDTIVVRAGGGEYRMPATLPVSAATGEAHHATSPDGSNAVAYFEKAAAAHFGSYDELKWDKVHFALVWLARDSDLSFGVSCVPAEQLSQQQLDGIIADGLPVGIAVPPGPQRGTDARHELAKDLGLTPGHGYSSEQLQWDATALNNPRAPDEPRTVSLDQIKDLGCDIVFLTP